MLKHNLWYRMAGNFHGKSEKALKINFHAFKFRDSNQSRGVALYKRWCNRYTCSISLAIFFVNKLDLQRLGQIAWDRRIVISVKDAIYQLDDNGYCCSLTLGSVGRAAMMLVATPITMDSHNHITVYINFRGWKNFMTASKPRKLAPHENGISPHGCLHA